MATTSRTGGAGLTPQQGATSAADTGSPAVADALADTPVRESMANDGKPVVTFEGPGAQVTVSSPPEGSTDGAQRPACLVNGGEGFHVGRATPGSVVCSYHAMHYNTDGTPRTDSIPDNWEFVGMKDAHRE